jgi:hypothetical protein
MLSVENVIDFIRAVYAERYVRTVSKYNENGTF